VIDNILWIDSWPSITGAGRDLIGAGASEEQVRKVDVSEASMCGQTSRLGSRDPVASRIKCGSCGGKNSKMKSWTVSWLSLKTKVEPERCGSRVMSGDSREATTNP
jgi:hypothetical protein